MANVNYAKSPTTSGGSVSGTVSVIDPPADAFPVTQMAPAPPSVTPGLAQMEFVPPSDPIFCALLSGEVSNRGITWYANVAPGTLAHRINLLKKTAQEIRNAYYATGTAH